MLLECIGPEYEDALRLDEIPDRVRHRPGPEDRREAGDGGRVAEPGAVVDVRRLERHPGELLHQVVLLVRCPGGGEAGHLVGFVGPELLRDQIVRLVPGRLDECAVLLDQRLREAIRAVDEFMGITSFGAELAPVDGCALPVRHVKDLAVANDKVEPAPGAAVRACR